MAQYIDKSVLVAEIERLLDRYISVHTFNYGATQDLNHLLSFVDTLEVKEVDLEKEVIDWWNAHYSVEGYPFKGHAGHYLENSTVIEIAKHFFELGLKAQKVE